MTRTCPTCDEKLAEDIDFCENCKQEFCPDCFAAMPAMSAKCDECGAEFALYCPQCDTEIEAWMDECSKCGFLFDEDDEADRGYVPDTVSSALGGGFGAIATAVATGKTAEEDEEQPDFNCPDCESEVYLTDGFCRHCGRLFCGKCGCPIGDEDELCPKCQTALYFACPNCVMELTAGTEICPNCNVTLPNYCQYCHAETIPGELDCPKCHRPAKLRVRAGAATAYVLPTESGALLRIIVCPKCSEKFNLAEVVCPNGDFRICPNCRVDLDEDETICPRCGREPESYALPADQQIEMEMPATENEKWLCPNCSKKIDAGSGECPHCEQLLCPDCGKRVDEEADKCPHCGAEFDLFCPDCGATLTDEDIVCPSCGTTFDD